MIHRMPFAKLTWSAIFFQMLVTAAVASPFDVWHPRSPMPTQYTFNGIAYGHGKFVAVANLGTIVTSTNGTNWTLQPPVTARSLSTIMFAEGLFIIGGELGTILWSTNGFNWIDASLPIDYKLTAFGFGRDINLPNGLFVAMASTTSSQARTLKLTSLDGMEWTTNATQGLGFLERGFTSIAFGIRKRQVCGFRSAGSLSISLAVPLVCQRYRLAVFEWRRRRSSGLRSRFVRHGSLV
jgi:hypothetical protein